MRTFTTAEQLGKDSANIVVVWCMATADLKRKPWLSNFDFDEPHEAADSKD